MIELSHIDIELVGMNLIEASAGTGKTYAISCLYLRLLIEQDLSPEQILVVTYTEAATKELRGRIRSRIREAIAVLDGASTDDSFLIELCKKNNRDQAMITPAREKLDLALKSFDTASIFTIHGFCLRALQDNSFESGSLYDTELVTDQTTLLQEVVDDFWRIRFFAPSAPLLAYALANRYSPEYFMKFVREIVANPKLKVIPTFCEDDIHTIEKICKSKFQQLQKIWGESQQEIYDIVHTHKGLSRSAKTYRQDLIPVLLENTTNFLSGENPFDLFKDFEKISSGYIEKHRLKRNPPPEHEFFTVCEELKQGVEKRFLALRWELIDFCRERLPRRKHEMNIRFFDDLLNDLYAALNGDSGEAFGRKLRTKYHAALIDEFQDTDPVQYDIFRAIYGDTDCPLFLIGDPKQAIYSFRGADIFAYLEASSDVADAKRFTLTGNWRSTPHLLAALNTVFAHSSNPFVYEQIAYHEITPGKDVYDKQLQINGKDSSPLQVWSLSAGDGGEVVNVGMANDIIPPAVAGEIAQLVGSGTEGKALIGDQPVVPGDIAVIVRSHRQAGFIQGALQKLGIPSVMRSDKSLFLTHEAIEVFTLLQSLADPGNESKVRAALVTDIFGKTGNDIAQFMDDEQVWEKHLQSFREYHQLWLDRGFMVMAQTLLSREMVRGRLLRFPNGERRVTNLLHCFEIIHKKAHQMALGIEGLLTWFGKQISRKDASEEYQIRLETDEKAVKIVTVHVSKGLEYPVVFCPFMWGGIRDMDEVVTFHDDYQMVKDFGSHAYNNNRVLAQRESLAENLRLLYVALTRAKYRCYLVAGKISDKTKKNRPETSPISYLLHSSELTQTQSDDLVRSLADEVSSLSSADVEEQLHAFEETGAETIAIVPIPSPPPEVSSDRSPEYDDPIACRTFNGNIKSDWRVASFTSLSVHDTKFSEQPDRDEARTSGIDIKTSTPSVPEEKGIFTFYKGAKTGIFWHELFENLDFNDCSSDSISSLVTEGLEKYGHESAWEPFLSKMVKNVVKTRLKTPSGSFSLSELKPGSWIPEMEFFFPLQFITSNKLRDCLKQYNPAYQTIDLASIYGTLQFKPVRGAVRGFIDMVFEHDGRYYLLDWKSNHLGYRLEDYGNLALKEAMEHNLYPLQYLLYTVALNRYLSLRIKDYDYKIHFGGVFYMFLRGMDAGQGEKYGVFRDLPPKALIDDLSNILIQSGGQYNNA